jgi:plastocyanin/mono/diheme cytochrome c family protein
MNTSKQINAMIVLLAILLVGVGIYTIWDPFRAEAETERTREEIGHRGAQLYVTNCVNCHGERGEGRIGPALEPGARRASGRDDWTDPAKLRENQQFVTNTLRCGRIGTQMPPWHVDQGGPLDDERIRQLVVLITENPGDVWAEVPELSHEAHADNPIPDIQTVLAGASITGSSVPVCGQPTVSGSPTPTPTPPPVTSNVTIVATDNRFDLAAISVPNANQSVTVTLQNRGQAAHNWKAEVQGRQVGTADIVVGGQSATANLTFSQPGTYRFLCTLHPVEMQGVLFVQ